MSKFEILHKCVRHKTTDLKFCIRFVRGWSTKRRIFCAVFWICSIIAYNYFYEDGKRVVTITNNTDIHIDKLVYDTTTSIMYLNGEIFWMPDDDMIQLQSGGMTADGWEILSTSSHYISWLQGTSVAVVAGAIAAFLGTLGTAGVIAAMGTAALSALAASTSGGTLYVELHMHSVPLVTPQYRFVWTFTASTGDSYGPFYYHYLRVKSLYH